MKDYYGKVAIIISGHFKADDVDEILEYPLGCPDGDYDIHTEIIEMVELGDGKLN